MKRAIVGVVAAVGLSILVPIATQVASAHANIISGVAACQEDGTYTVTWTVANDLDIEETVTLEATG